MFLLKELWNHEVHADEGISISIVCSPVTADVGNVQHAHIWSHNDAYCCST